jgi:flagellar motor component MotA
MSKFYFPALILVLIVFAIGIIWSAGNLLMFVDLAWLIIIVIPTILLCFTTFSPADIGRSFQASFGRGGAPEKDLKISVVFFKALQRYLVLSACIGSVIGLIAILTNIQDKSSVGMGLAILLDGAFYSALMIMIVAVPFRAAAERKLAEMGGPAR